TDEVAMHQAPEGLIDPWLRTVTFFAGEKPLAQLHYYATHPQSFYGDARVSWDVPGIARDRLEHETHVFQTYFSGCSGNITMGKYNDGSRSAREELAGRLYAAMRQSAAAGSSKKGTPASADEAAMIDYDVDISALESSAIDWKVAQLRF